MPIAYDIDPRLDLLYVAGFGLCTGRQYVQANRAAAADARRRPGQKTLLDMRGVTALSIGPEDMDAILEMDRELAAEGVYGTYQTALLARSPAAVETIIGKLYNARMREEGMRVEVFHRIEDALAWLGLADAQAQIEQTSYRLMRAA